MEFFWWNLAQKSFKAIVIESKLFSLAKDGGGLVITEESWRVKSRLSLGPSTVHWLAKALIDCSKEVKHGLFTSIREGSQSFLAQRCSNGRGRYIVVVEYGSGGRRNSVIVPEEKDGSGWRKMREALWELLQERKNMANHAILQSSVRNEPLIFYKEALLVEPPRQISGGNVQQRGGWHRGKYYVHYGSLKSNWEICRIKLRI